MSQAGVVSLSRSFFVLTLGDTHMAETSLLRVPLLGKPGGILKKEGAL